MSDNVQDWESWYRAERVMYESLVQRVKTLLEDLCGGKGVGVAQIECRAKEVKSFVEKITRKRYSDPRREMTDLAAFRVITFYAEDVARVGDVIRAEFRVDEENSGDKGSLLEADRFGYTSVHFVVSLGEQRARLEEWKKFEGIRFEIQVRTMLQHAWAAVNHKLDYKSVGEAPQELRRKLFRLSALFEMADEQFSSIRDEADRISEGYRSDVKQKNFELPLDLSSLVAYLDSSPQRDVLARMAARLGMAPDKANPLEVARDQRDLLNALESCGFKSISEVDDYFRGDTFPRVFNFITPWLEQYYPTLENVLTEAVLLDRKGLDLFRAIYADGVQESFERNMKEYHEGLDKPTVPNPALSQ